MCGKRNRGKRKCGIICAASCFYATSSSNKREFDTYIFIVSDTLYTETHACIMHKAYIAYKLKQTYFQSPSWPVISRFVAETHDSAYLAYEYTQPVNDCVSLRGLCERRQRENGCNILSAENTIRERCYFNVR